MWVGVREDGPCDDHRGEQGTPPNREELLNVGVAEGDDDVDADGGE